jgi:hypothetical protein
MDSTPDASDSAAAGKPSLKQRFKTLIAESGAIVLWVYFGIFGLVLICTATALKMGVKLDGVAGAAGIWGAAYLFTKLTQPLRIAATLAITPAIAATLRRFRKPAPAPDLATAEPSSGGAPSATGRQSQQ